MQSLFVRILHYGIIDKSKFGVWSQSRFELVCTPSPCSDVSWLHLGLGMECVVMMVSKEHPVPAEVESYRWGVWTRALR